MPARSARSSAAHARLVRRDGDDRQSRVDQRLQVRAFARDEDADHAPSILPIDEVAFGRLRDDRRR